MKYTNNKLTYREKQKLILFYNKLTIFLEELYNLFNIGFTTSPRIFNLYSDGIKHKRKHQFSFQRIEQSNQYKDYTFTGYYKDVHREVLYIMGIIELDSYMFLDQDYKTEEIEQILNSLNKCILKYNKYYDGIIKMKSDNVKKMYD